MGAGITVTRLTVGRKVFILNAGRAPAVMTDISWFLFLSCNKCWDISSEYVVVASCHIIYSLSFMILPFGGVPRIFFEGGLR
jgi:hypothetical protein